VAIGDVVLGPASRARALPRQNLEIIAVIGRPSPGGV
jgi:hypothetical protein